MKKLFTQHPESIGETYFEHFKFAFKSGCLLTFAGIACIIHSIFPFLFITTASTTMANISKEITERNHKKK